MGTNNINIFVRKAECKEDFRNVFDTRWRGYQKYFSRKNDVIEESDFWINSILLIAEDEHHGPVGTLKLLDRKYGSIELDSFIDVDAVLPANKKSCVEATRFSVPRHRHSKLIKLLLWKTFFIYCQLNAVHEMIMAVRSAAAARDYTRLNFHNVGPMGTYRHEQLGDLEHQTYILGIDEVGELLLKNNSLKLYDFFFTQDYPNIDWSDLLMEYPEDQEISGHNGFNEAA